MFNLNKLTPALGLSFVLLVLAPRVASAQRLHLLDFGGSQAIVASMTDAGPIDAQAMSERTMLGGLIRIACCRAARGDQR